MSGNLLRKKKHFKKALGNNFFYEDGTVDFTTFDAG